MRIAICTDQYLPMISGLVDSVDLLAQQLQKNGHEVRVYAPNLPGAAQDERVFRFPAWALPGSGGTVIINFPIGAMRDLRRFKPDVIHTHLFGMAGFLAWYAARRLNVPLVGTDHTFPADYLHYVKLNWEPFRYLVKRFAAWFYNRCDMVTVPSENLRKELLDYGLYTPSVIISNHIPSDIFRPLFKEECKKKLGITHKAVLVFGRIAVEKNLDVALEAYAEVATYSDAELVVVGDGPYRQELEANVRAKKLESRVRFLGTLRGEQLVEAINACEVFLMTSTSENQPMSMLQAFACGLPVVIANAGGPPQYVREGETGYIVEPQDIKLFAKRILELLQNDERAVTMGEQGRESILPYSPERITRQFEELYERLVKSK